MDGLDRDILNMLIANGRISVRNIAKRLSEKGINMSERGIGKRIARLEREKVIIGYSTMVDLQKVNMSIPRLITVKFTSPKDFLQRVEDMKKYLTEAPFCDFSARTNGDIDWIELKFFNNSEQAKKEEDLYRAWFGDIIEEYKSYDLGIQKVGWQIFDESSFDRFIQQMIEKKGSTIVASDSIALSKRRRVEQYPIPH